MYGVWRCRILSKSLRSYNRPSRQRAVIFMGNSGKKNRRQRERMGNSVSCPGSDLIRGDGCPVCGESTFLSLNDGGTRYCQKAHAYIIDLDGNAQEGTYPDYIRRIGGYGTGPPSTSERSYTRIKCPVCGEGAKWKLYDGGSSKCDNGHIFCETLEGKAFRGPIADYIKKVGGREIYYEKLRKLWEKQKQPERDPPSYFHI